MRPFPFFRLRLTSLWPAVAALTAASVLLGWWLLPDLVQRNAEEHLLDWVQILTPVAAEQGAAEQGADEQGADESRQLQAWVEELTRSGTLRLTVIRDDGLVLADSDQSWQAVQTMDNHAGRPEVASALQDGSGAATRTSKTTGLAYVYAARAYSAGNRRLILRVAKPLRDLDLLRNRLLQTTAAAAALGLLVLALTYWRLDSRFFRPLSQLLDAADRLGGEEQQQLELPQQLDLARLAAALNRLDRRVHEQLATLQDERDHLQRILASMHEGVLVTDRSGRARLANQAFLRLFRLVDADSVIGRLPLELSRQRQLAEVIEASLSGTGESQPEQILETPRDRVLALTGTALTGASSVAGAAEVAGAVVVARDITEQQRLTRMRRDFVANVSHELKTPLAAIRGYAETLRDGALEDKPAAERFTDRILVQCQRLQVLLEDLLTLSRLESVAQQPDLDPVDLVRLAERTAELVVPVAQEQNVELALALEPVPAIVGIHNDLERLLLNLLHNAIKYNRAGGRVTLRLAPVGDQVCLEVEDSGIGIPVEVQPRIFERFYRVDKDRSRSAGGTGLGLSIVKHIVQAHEGTLEVESTLGVGSRFRVLLPIEPLQRPA